MCLFNPLNAELNPIYHLLALLGAHHILHVSRVRVNLAQFFKGFIPVVHDYNIKYQNDFFFVFWAVHFQ